MSAERTVFAGDEVRIAPGRSPWKNDFAWMGGWARVTEVDDAGVTVHPKGFKPMKYGWTWVTDTRSATKSGDTSLRQRIIDLENRLLMIDRGGAA